MEFTARPLDESEAKFVVPASFELPDLTGCLPGLVVQDEGHEHLDATYYDTADLALLGRGITVRFRRGDTSGSWTVKHPLPHPTGPGDDASPGPGAMLRRSESNLAVAGHTDLPDQGPAQVPPQVSAQVVGETAGDPLVPVARLHTVRHSLLLTASGRRLATVTDDEVEVTDNSQGVARFREVEVEVAPTLDAREGDEVARSVGSVLAAAGALAEPPLPKLERALGLLGRIGLPGRAGLAGGTSETAGP